jgi:hypothetical protein
MRGVVRTGYAGGRAPGGATFGLGIDDEPFKQVMQRAQQEAQRASEAVKARLDQICPSAGSAALGLVGLGQAAEDFQRVFRAVTNNLPPIPVLMRGSAGITGGAASMGEWVKQRTQSGHKFTDVPGINKTGEIMAGFEQLRQKSEQMADAGKRAMSFQEARAKEFAKMVKESPVGKILESFAHGMRDDGPDTELHAGDPDKGPDTSMFDGITRGIASMIDQNLQAFRRGALGEIARMNPDEIKHQPELKKQDAVNANGMTEKPKRQREEEKKGGDQRELEIRANAGQFERQPENRERDIARRGLQSPAGAFQFGGAADMLIKRGLESFVKSGAIARELGMVDRNQKLMKEESKDAIEKKMQETGMTPEEAARSLRQENFRRNLPPGIEDAFRQQERTNARGGIFGPVEFSRHIQMGAMSSDNVPKQQLTAQQRTAMLLESIDQTLRQQLQRGNVAVAGRP